MDGWAEDRVAGWVDTNVFVFGFLVVLRPAVVLGEVQGLSEVCFLFLLWGFDVFTRRLIEFRAPIPANP